MTDINSRFKDIIKQIKADKAVNSLYKSNTIDDFVKKLQNQKIKPEIKPADAFFIAHGIDPNIRYKGRVFFKNPYTGKLLKVVGIDKNSQWFETREPNEELDFIKVEDIDIYRLNKEIQPTDIRKNATYVEEPSSKPYSMSMKRFLEIYNSKDNEPAVLNIQSSYIDRGEKKYLDLTTDAGKELALQLGTEKQTKQALDKQDKFKTFVNNIKDDYPDLYKALENKVKEQSSFDNFLKNKNVTINTVFKKLFKLYNQGFDFDDLYDEEVLERVFASKKQKESIITEANSIITDKGELADRLYTINIPTQYMTTPIIIPALVQMGRTIEPEQQFVITGIDADNKIVYVQDTYQGTPSGRKKGMLASDLKQLLQKYENKQKELDFVTAHVNNPNIHLNQNVYKFQKISPEKLKALVKIALDYAKNNKEEIDMLLPKGMFKSPELYYDTPIMVELLNKMTDDKHPIVKKRVREGETGYFVRVLVDPNGTPRKIGKSGSFL